MGAGYDPLFARAGYQFTSRRQEGEDGGMMHLIYDGVMCRAGALSGDV